MFDGLRYKLRRFDAAISGSGNVLCDIESVVKNTSPASMPGSVRSRIQVPQILEQDPDCERLQENGTKQ